MGNSTEIPRLMDVAAFHADKDAADATLLQHSLGDVAGNGSLVSGIAGLAQRFLLELLTDRGSMQYQPERGCGFLQEARRGGLQTPLDIAGAISRALIQIARNLALDNTATTPADEQLDHVVIQQIRYSAGHAVIHLQLQSKDYAATAALPIRINV